jgi:hypothetical protein
MSQQQNNLVTDGSRRGHARVEALYLAWLTWLILLAAPFVLLPFALQMSPDGRSPRPDLAEEWFLIVMVYLLVAVPSAVLVRERLFRSFWVSRAVRPRSYYIGMCGIWVVVALAGLAAELVCVATATLMPNVVAAAIALLVYLTLWPTGMAVESDGRNSESDREARCLVKAREVEMSEWRPFFDRFSRAHQGQRISVESAGRDFGVQTNARNLPLIGVTAEPKVAGPPEIQVVVGESPGASVTHVIPRPAKVSIAEWNDFVSVAVRIEADDGLVTLLQAGPSEQTLPAGCILDDIDRPVPKARPAMRHRAV